MTLVMMHWSLSWVGVITFSIWTSCLILVPQGYGCLKIHISNVPKLRNTKYTIWTFKNIKSFKNRLSSVKIRACWILDLLSAVPDSGCLKIHVSKVLMWKHKKYTIWTFRNIQNFENRFNSRLRIAIRSWTKNGEIWGKWSKNVPQNLQNMKIYQTRLANALLNNSFLSKKYWQI